MTNRNPAIINKVLNNIDKASIAQSDKFNVCRSTQTMTPGDTARNGLRYPFRSNCRILNCGILRFNKIKEEIKHSRYENGKTI